MLVLHKVVKALADKKVKMVPFSLNYTVPSAQFSLNVTMDVETLAHFDHWQRAGEDVKYEDQTAWPVELRRARFIPAVDYIQVTSLRTYSGIFPFFCRVWCVLVI